MSYLRQILSAAAFDHSLLLKCISRILLSQLFESKNKAGCVPERVIQGGMQICMEHSPYSFQIFLPKGCNRMQLVLT